MICLNEDDWTQNKYLISARWEAILSDHSIVIDDSDRPDYSERSAWLRLKYYLTEKKLNIIGLRIRFRDHVIEPVPRNAPAYFLRDGACASLHQQITKKILVVGHLDPVKQEILTQVFITPELRLLYSEWRDPNDVDKVGESLIYNDKK